jgi:hypothetical protein
MKGYAFLNADYVLGYRTKDYIDNDNPSFWQQNKMSIIRKWIFDTEDMTTIQRLFMDCRDLQVPGSTLKELCGTIGLSPDALKEFREEQANASKVQSTKN